MWAKNITNSVLIGLILSACSLSRDTSGSTLFNEDVGEYFKSIKEFNFKLKPYNSSKMASINYGHAIENMASELKDSILNEYDNYLCFLLEIDIKGFTGEITDYDPIGKESDYDQKVNYYLFEMQHDLKLTDIKGSQYPCLIYFYERLSELNKANRFVIGFKKPSSNDICFEYDNPFINCGKIKFSIEKQHLAIK